MSDDLPPKYGAWLSRVRDRVQPQGHGSQAQRAPDGEAEASPTTTSVIEASYAVVSMDDPHSAAAEQYRVLAARLEGLRMQPRFRKIAITSTLPGEGKTFTSVNVACILARDFGRRVLLIDGDLKRPSVWRYFGDRPIKGLTDALIERQSPDAMVKSVRHEQLSVLQAGLTPVNPTRLWKSPAIKHLLEHFETQYDYMIVDTPPVLTVVDPTLIADLVDGIVVVVRSGVTPQAALQKALAMLPRAKLVGTVLNAAKVERAFYYYYRK
jgi:capsular exopolysaccharide synthesis family protein